MIGKCPCRIASACDHFMGKWELSTSRRISVSVPAHQRQHGDEKQDQERAGVEEGRAPARGLGIGQNRHFSR